MSNQQNDLSLLRPFNLEAAKSGEDICWSNISDEVEFIGVSSTRLIAYESDGELGFICQAALRMKPLCWVDGLPVYKGDVLYGKTYPYYRYNVKGMSSSGNILSEQNETNSFCESPSELTWNKPKPKTKVKLKVWINVYPDGIGAVYETKSMADYNCNEEFRIACVETEIEYEV